MRLPHECLNPRLDSGSYSFAREVLHKFFCDLGGGHKELGWPPAQFLTHVASTQPCVLANGSHDINPALTDVVDPHPSLVQWIHRGQLPLTFRYSSPKESNHPHQEQRVEKGANPDRI
jgi:hypothetical protein